MHDGVAKREGRTIDRVVRVHHQTEFLSQVYVSSRKLFDGKESVLKPHG